MNMKPVIQIISVRLGRNSNWLQFQAFIPHLDLNKKYTLDFCRTELLTSASISDETIEDLRKCLCKKFVHMPFDIKKCKDILGKNGLTYPFDFE